EAQVILKNTNKGDLSVKVGTGHVNWTDTNLDDHTLTCDEAHPCDLIVQLQVTYDTWYVTVPLAYGNAPPRGTTTTVATTTTGATTTTARPATTTVGAAGSGDVPSTTTGVPTVKRGGAGTPTVAGQIGADGSPKSTTTRAVHVVSGQNATASAAGESG